MLSFGQVDAYLSCPLRYKYAHVLRVPSRRTMPSSTARRCTRPSSSSTTGTHAARS